MCEREGERQGGLAFGQVCPEPLAYFRRITRQIENVVDDLKSQPDFFSELPRDMDQVFTLRASRSTATGKAEQRSGLAAYDLEIALHA